MFQTSCADSGKMHAIYSRTLTPALRQAVFFRSASRLAPSQMSNMMDIGSRTLFRFSRHL
jgi:hypothetical protein